MGFSTSKLASSGDAELQEDQKNKVGKNNASDPDSPPATVDGSLELNENTPLEPVPSPIENVSSKKEQKGQKKSPLWKQFAIDGPDPSLLMPDQEAEDQDPFGTSDSQLTNMDTEMPPNHDHVEEQDEGPPLPPPHAEPDTQAERPPLPPPHAEPDTQAEQPQPADAGEPNHPEAGSHTAAPSSSNGMVPASVDAQKDVTGQFLDFDQAMAVANLEPVSESQKEIFMGAKLIVPGIALKKFKLALVDGQERSSCFLGVMGVGDMTMYKTTRPKLTGLVVGDFLTDPKEFWQWVQEHLCDKPVGALFVFDRFRLPIQDATWF